MLSSLLIFQLYQQIIVRIELQCGSGGGFWLAISRNYRGKTSYFAPFLRQLAADTVSARAVVFHRRKFVICLSAQ